MFQLEAGLHLEIDPIILLAVMSVNGGSKLADRITHSAALYAPGQAASLGGRLKTGFMAWNSAMAGCSKAALHLVGRSGLYLLAT